MSNKFTKAQFIQGFLLTCLLGIVVFAVIFAMGSKGMTQCKSDDHDQCILQAVDMERADRDAFKEAREKEIADFITIKNKEITDYVTAKDTVIEGYKEQLSPKTIEQEFKANRSQNVPTRLLRLMVPQASANSDTFLPAPVESSDDISLNTEEAKSTYMAIQIDTETSTHRYDAVLAKYNAPYKNVDIEQYCNDAGLVQWRCDIMVAIAQQESQMGKDFHCIQQTDAHSIELGQTYYHNPMGLTDKNVHWKKGVKGKTADFNGCFLRKFDSWDAFWKFMPQSFMDPNMKYYVGNWNNAVELSGIWVNGFKSEKGVKDWYTTVNQVIKKI